MSTPEEPAPSPSALIPEGGPAESAEATPTLAIPGTAEGTVSPTADTPTPSSDAGSSPSQPPAEEAGDVPTPTETPTETSTSTATPTSTPTTTATSTPGIILFSVDPKPLKGNAAVRWGLAMPVDQVIFKVYTSSFRLVRSQRFESKRDPQLTGPGPAEIEWDVTDGRHKPLVPGTYFFYLTAKVGHRSWEARDQAVVP